MKIEKLLFKIAGETGADAAAFMVPDLNEKYLLCHASYNMPIEWTSIKNSLSEYTNKGNSHVFNSSDPVLINDYDGDLYGHYQNAYLIVPVIKSSKVIGTLELVSTIKDKVFRKVDIHKAIIAAADISKNL